MSSIKQSKATACSLGFIVRENMAEGSEVLQPLQTFTIFTVECCVIIKMYE